MNRKYPGAGRTTSGGSVSSLSPVVSAVFAGVVATTAAAAGGLVVFAEGALVGGDCPRLLPRASSWDSRSLVTFISSLGVNASIRAKATTVKRGVNVEGLDIFVA